MRIPYLVPAFALALGACALDVPSEGTTDQSIINGIVDTSHPWTVRVLLSASFAPSAPACTGVIVASSSIVTAAHCVTDGAWYYVDFGSGTGFQWQAHVNPAYDGTYNDVAVLRTGDKVLRPHANIATGVYVGEPMVVSGYGVTSFSGTQDGIKRYGTNTIDSFDASFIYFDMDGGPPGTESGTCYGDSGGPAYVGDKGSNCVAAITKYEQLPVTCAVGGGADYDTRIDTQLTWIQSVSRDHIATCTP